MKNLSAFPRFPLSEALMILITLVVCLAGFTKAEVNTNYKKQDPSLQKNENFLLKEASFMKNFPDTHQASEMRGRELRGKHFFNLKNFPESFLDRPIKRQSDYFGDSNDSDSEKENDGYGYDDDEYYHFNYKRNDEPNGKIESNKSEKENIDETKDKELNMIPSDTNNQVNPKTENNPETQSIEVLNYQESHPVVAQEDPANPFHNSKSFPDGVAHPKTPSSSSISSSLSGIDFKENSAIDENTKERKEEAVLANSESKITDTKKATKVTDEKEPSKLQDSKIEADPEKKEKDLALKEGKDAVTAKSLKDTSKTSEGKEKTVKLTDSAKLQDNLEKITSGSKNKESESSKLTKEDKDGASFTEKLNSEMFNANGLSQIAGGASFVGNDYKDNLDVLKSIRSEGDQNSFGEPQEVEKNIGFGEYTKEAKENQEKFKEKRINALKSERARNFEFLNRQSNLIKALQGTGKASPYPKGSPNLDYQASNNFFRRREPWRESEKMSPKLAQEYQLGQQLQQQQMQQFQQQQQQIKDQQLPNEMSNNFEAQMKHSLTNLPPNELENTEYHKNYMKSLKKYKAQNENARNSTGDAGFYMTPETANLCPKAESKKKKRSKQKKRRSMALESSSEDQGKSHNEKNRIRNQKRKAYSADDSLSDPIQQCLKKPHGSQSLNEIKTNKEETNLLDDKKYFDQWNGNRKRRKSPQKLEYEIKIINQKQPDMKNAKFSHFVSNRLKKNVKTKLGTEDKYLKKYPYSQVSRDELTKMSGIREVENEKKFKRKASIWKRDDQKSVIQTRAVPSGYYSNRVKFGQKSYVKNNNEKGAPEPTNEEVNRLSQTYFSQPQNSEANKNILQRAWEIKRPNLKHDPTKRFDDNQHSNVGSSGNSLFLVKKDERLTKVFQEENPSKSANENELSTGQLAKMLSNDKNYVFFKKPETDKLRKNCEIEPFPLNLNELGGSSYANKKFPFLDSSSGTLNNNGWSTPLKSLNIRSSHSEKNDKKFTSAFQNSATNSNLKKAIDKFRDMADFFKDNEQENTDNRFSNQEAAKEGPDIVFSQDKLPDPIIISNDDNNKETGFKQEPVNSIFAISNNFRNLDQQTKKIDFPDPKNESPESNPDSTWKPALKQAFPEAKSINSVIKNGNEIIVLDLNGNPLKLEREHSIYRGPTRETPRGVSSRVFLINPNQYVTSKKQESSYSDVPFVSETASNPQQSNQQQNNQDDQDRNTDKNRMNLLSSDRAVAIIRSADNQSEIPGSLHELAELPDILKTIMIKVPIDSRPTTKMINRKSLNEKSQSEMPQNYNQFYQDFGKLSQMKIKKEIILSPNGFLEQPVYNDRSMRNIGEILQSLLSPVNPSSGKYNDLTFDNSKNLYENQKLDQQFQNLVNYQPDITAKRQNRWSNQEKSRDFIPFGQEMWENSLKPSEEINNILRLDGGSLSENNNENKLRKELAAASEKIHRLRREGMEAGKLRKTIEDALTFKETREADQSKEFSESKEDDKNKKYNSDTVALKSDDKAAIAEESESEKNLKCPVKEVEESKDNSEAEKSSKSDYENHLSELFENLNANKNQKSSNGNTWNKKKRMDTNRRKRFTERDVSNKMSKTEAQNKDEKSMVEDNYESVYSPGIKRKLLSISDETEEEDNDDKHVNNFDGPNGEENCVKNDADLDPMIVKLFSVDRNEEEKNRARRSLSTAFHSNFKREIDLDESMPNDFQNFLVTSLGGFGSQKREVVKKGEAIWEGKEISQDNYNQIVENGKDANEDSALEKREVSSSENQKSQSYKNPLYFNIGSPDSTAGDGSSVTDADKNDPSLIKIKPSKFADEKLPTQIRIQISNTSTKEKKSSKPIMDENETTSNDMENLPKEKEFFDKNKINPLLSTNFMKLRQRPGITYSDNDFESLMNRNLNYKRKPFRPYWWDERLRKKSTGESPIRSAQDFSTFDQKAVESLLQNQQSTPEADRIAQKVSMITGLPQVETVYNPTQGANKAQIENSRLAKTNNIKNKGALSTKNNLQSTEASSYDDGFLKSYFKVEDLKSDKGGVKEYGDPEWKLFNDKMSLDQDSYVGGSPVLQGESASFSGSNMSPINFNSFRSGNQKWLQSPPSNYFYHSPSNVMNSQVMYDVMKLKQQMKNRNGYEKDNSELKQYLKPILTNENEIQDNTQKSKASLPSFPNWLDSNSNGFEYSFSRKPLNDYPESKTYENNGLKAQPPKEYGIFKHAYSIDGTFSRNSFERPSQDSSQTNPVDNTKDNDYMDGLEDEYPEAEMNREPQSDDGLYKIPSKEPNKAHENPNYRRFYTYKNFKKNLKNSEIDNNMNDDEKEFEEEYDENGENEDLEDYSQLGFKKEVEPEMTRFSHDSPKFQDGFFRDLNSKQYSYYPDTKSSIFDDIKYNSNSESKTNLDVPLEDLKSDADTLSGSDDILKKANEKSNIFGKNLMKKLYGTSNDDIFNRLDKFQNEKSAEDTYHLFKNKLSKRKLNFQTDLNKNPDTGNSRVFYAAKFQLGDNKAMTPTEIFLPANKRLTRHTYYRLPERSLFNAKFEGGENDFDPEFEEHGIHFNDNFVSPEKKGFSQNENNHLDGYEDVEENLEDGGEDNVLENVIGKYIMRKRIKSSVDTNKDSETLSADSSQHRLKKRSVEMERFDGQGSKVIKKRLSSGHLTENNFRKYHKKNPTKKRHINNLLSIPYTFTALIDENDNSVRKEKAKDQMKRSALDIFRKITNKEKDKRVDNSDGRSAGFEPLLSLNDKSKGFIKEPKDTISLQEKQLPKDNPPAELKSNPPELKAHYPNEGQRLRAQIADRKKGKAKEAEQVPLTLNAQGPWKVELNDKYDLFDLKKDNNGKPFKEAEKTVSSVNNQNGRYKAFLVISNNANAAEQNSKTSHPSVSGLFHRESSSSYWPKSDECIRLSTNHVRKRSLKSSINQMETKDKDSSQTSASHALKERNAGKDINKEKQNTGPDNAKTLSEGDSKIQAPQVVQRSTKKNRSFATDLEENRNSQLFSKEKLNNRKSVFPPSSDANIIRDSRHINEETSEYHSQRIVDAILSKVSENSKFKELIAPGLAMRTPVNREVTDSKSKATAEMNFSEELQSFLQKFMFDLENLAEQHVEKRMCNSIDDDLKQFLQSLLSIPEGNNVNDNKNSQPEKCSFLPLNDMSIKKNLSRIDQNIQESKQKVLDDLRKKQLILKKLIEHYQNLPNVKKTLNTNYRNLLQELEQVSGKLKSSKHEPNSNPNNHGCNYTQTKPDTNNSGLKYEQLETGNATSSSTAYLALKTANPNNHTIKSNSGTDINLKPVTKTNTKNTLPVLCFYKIKNPNQEDIKKTTPPSLFEKTITVNDSNLNCNNSVNKEKQNKTKSETNHSEQKNSTPVRFDLLPVQSSTKKPKTGNYDSPMINTGTIQAKHSSSNSQRFFKRSEPEKTTDLKDSLTQSLNSPKKSHKHNHSDAAGLQHASKNQGSWVSNPEISKTNMNVPSITRSKTFTSQQKGGTQLLEKNSNYAMDIPSVEDFRNPKTLVDNFNEYSDESNRNLNIENFYLHTRPRLFFGTYKRIYIPRCKPFNTVSECIISGPNCFKFRPNFVLIRAPLPRKQICNPPGGFNCICRLQKPPRKCKLIKRKTWKKRNFVPRFLTRHPKRLKEILGEKGGNLPEWSKPPESVFESPSAKSQPVINNPPINESDDIV